MGIVARVRAGFPPQIVARVREATPPGGTGNGSVPIGTVPSFGDVPLSTVSTNAYVYWTSVAGSVIEGDSVVITAQLSRPLQHLAFIDIEQGSGTTADTGAVTLPVTRLEFPPNTTEQSFEIQTSGTAAQGTSKVFEAEMVPATVGEPSLAIRPALGPVLYTLEITNRVVVPTPSWSFGGGNRTVLEAQAGVVPLTINLNAPVQAGDEVRISVSDTGSGTAVADRDYVGFDPIEVVLTEGQTSATFQIATLDNGLTIGTDPVLELTGTIVSGTVQAGSPTTIEITIEERDMTAVIPHLSFLTGNQPLREGQSLVAQVQITNQDGTEPLAFEEATTIDYTLEYLNGAEAVDFTVVPAGGVAGSLLFQPDASTSTMTITSNADIEDDAGERLLIRLLADMDNKWRVRVPNALTITSADAVAQETQVLVPEMDAAGGAIRMIQGLVAVNPASSTLPEFTLSTGERVQTVAGRRNGFGQYESAYVYGFAPRGESIPGSGTELTLREAETGDSLPTASGTFIAPPNLQFIVQPFVAASSTTYWCETTGQDEAKVMDWTSPTSPHFAQVGADLVRETVHQMRPIQLTGAPSPRRSAVSGESLGIVECTIRQIAGDDDVYICEGEWSNGAWADKDPVTGVALDQFVENPYCDGEVNLETIRVRLKPDGAADDYVIDLVDPSPVQANSGTDDVTLLTANSGGSFAHYFPPCSQYQFQFVIRRPTAAAAAKARHYLQLRNVAWFVGDFGPTRNEIYGEAGDPCLDYGRAGFLGVGQSGWRGIKAIGELQGNGGSFLGEVDAWTSGAASASSTAQIGWWRATGPAGAGGASGDNIYGAGALIPWWGYWYRMRTKMFAEACRFRAGYRDVGDSFDASRVDYGQAFWWKTSDGTNVSMQGTNQFLPTNTHWQMTAPGITLDDLGSNLQANQVDPTVFALAPTDRPWNSPGASADPNRFALEETYPQEKLTHFARIRDGMNDMWWACRSRNSYAILEKVAAMMTRIFAPQEPGPYPTRYPSRNNVSEWNPAQAIAQFQGLGDEYRQASLWPYPIFNDKGYQSTGGVLRAHGWAMMNIAQFYSMATPVTRASFTGVSPEVISKGGQSLLDTIFNFYDLQIEESGLIGRDSSDNANPNPYNPVFGLSDFTTRNGAFPRESLYPDNHTTWALFFHYAFFLRAMSAMDRYCTLPSSFRSPGRLGRIFDGYENWVAGMKTWTTDLRNPYVPRAFSNAFGDAVKPASVNVGPPTKVTAQQVRDGEAYWRQRDPVTFAYDEIVYSNSFWKTGWLTYHSARQAGRDEYLETQKAVLGFGDISDQDFATFLMTDPLIGINKLLGDGSRGLFSEYTFILPYLANLWNRIS